MTQPNWQTWEEGAINAPSSVNGTSLSEGEDQRSQVRKWSAIGEGKSLIA
jgi:hypothetical protein